MLELRQNIYTYPNPLVLLCWPAVLNACLWQSILDVLNSILAENGINDLNAFGPVRCVLFAALFASFLTRKFPSLEYWFCTDEYQVRR